jgi:hypothetical protein
MGKGRSRMNLVNGSISLNNTTADDVGATNPGDAPVAIDPDVDVCIETVDELRCVLPGLWQRPPVFEPNTIIISTLSFTERPLNCFSNHFFFRHFFIRLSIVGLRASIRGGRNRGWRVRKSGHSWHSTPHSTLCIHHALHLRSHGRIAHHALHLRSHGRIAHHALHLRSHCRIAHHLTDLV